MSAKQQAADQNFSPAVLDWFAVHGRKHLPWQQNPTPYRVWVSEIMLQQTQVSTVIPYYERFMQRFADVAALAQAHEDEVLHYWTGLGYYARARNLHKTAKVVHEQHQNVFPDKVDALSELPGIGRSTAGAIVALATGRRAVILDGNVKRVLCRYHCIEGWPEQSSTLKQLWELAERYTPQNHCREYAQAMMDLGATICTRSKPLCPQCPLQDKCQAKLTDRCADFPQRKPRKALPVKATCMLILQSPDQTRVLLEKRPPQGIWGGLWSFPELEDDRQVDEFLQKHGMQAASTGQTLSGIRHTFSHFHLDIKPRIRELTRESGLIMEKPGWHWYDLKQPQELGLAAPVKSLLQQLEAAL